MAESLSSANRSYLEVTQKQVMVRTPRRGRSKSIVILDSRDKPRNFPIGRLNNYSKQLKGHRGPLSLMSELESIDEIDKSDDQMLNQFSLDKSNDCIDDADDSQKRHCRGKKQAKSVELNQDAGKPLN